LVEVDLDGMSTALGRVFQMIVDPMAERGVIPDDVLKGMLQATLRTVLQALGVDAEEVAGDEKWEVEREEEIEEGGPGSGWFAPPKGTHGKGSQGGRKTAQKAKREGGKAPTEKRDDWGSALAHKHLVDGLDIRNPQRAPEHVRSDVKWKITKKLSEETDVPIHETNDVIGQWAKTSSDDDMRSLALQQDAADEFGVTTSKFTQEKIDNINAKYKHRKYKWPAHARPLIESGKQKAILRAMYDDTQSKLAEIGFEKGDTIRLQRGIQLPPDIASAWKSGDMVKLSTNPLSSWTSDTSTEISSRFARHIQTPGDVGVIVEMDVPISMIQSTARTGFGCLTEEEFIVLGGANVAHEVRVIRTYP